MNTGIQDAVNLGWKLGYAVRGWGDRKLLLESYEPERRPVAQDVVKGATQKLHLMFGDNPVLPALRNVAIPLLSRIPAARRRMQMDLSETEIVYAGGPLMALGGASPHPRRAETGGRARDATLHDPVSGGPGPLWPKLAGLAHTLLLFGGAAAQPLPPAVQDSQAAIQVAKLDAAADPGGGATARYGLSDGWVLIRPDQVVAARGGATDWAVLPQYLQRVCLPSAAVP